MGMTSPFLDSADQEELWDKLRACPTGPKC